MTLLVIGSAIANDYSKLNYFCKPHFLASLQREPRHAARKLVSFHCNPKYSNQKPLAKAHSKFHQTVSSRKPKLSCVRSHLQRNHKIWHVNCYFLHYTCVVIFIVFNFIFARTRGRKLGVRDYTRNLPEYKLIRGVRSLKRRLMKCG